MSAASRKTAKAGGGGKKKAAVKRKPKTQAKKNRSGAMSVEENSGAGKGSAKPSTGAVAGLGAEDMGGAGNLAKVRDILFGTQMRDYDKRFSRLEERLAKELEDLQQDTKKRTESLELFIKKEVEALVDRLKAEQDERKHGEKEAARELKDLAGSFEKKVGQLAEQMDRGERNLRQHILEQANQLRDEMQQNQAEMQAMLEREVQELREAKADRAALGDLFMEMAMRLNEEFQLPETE